MSRPSPARSVFRRYAFPIVCLLCACCAQGASPAPTLPSEGLVLVTDRLGIDEAQWVERPGPLLLERPDSVLFASWQGERRLRWERRGRRILLGGHLLGHDWLGLSAQAVGRRIARQGPSAGWLIVGPEALSPQVVRRLGRGPVLRLAVVCPLEGRCDLTPLSGLRQALVGLSLKEARLAPADARILGRLEALRVLSLRGARLPPGTFAALGRLRHLEALDLAGAELRGWRRFPTSLPRLEWLDLSFTTVTGAALAALRGLPQLRVLRLASTPLHDRALGALSALRGLRELDVSLTGIGDRGLTALSELTTLRSLDLRDTAVTDLGAPALARLHALRLLRAPRHLSDRGLRWLDGLRELEGLSLRGTRVTGPGLHTLARLPQLWWLDLAGTGVGSEAIATLRCAQRRRAACP